MLFKSIKVEKRAGWLSYRSLLCVVITEPMKYVFNRPRPRKQSIADRILPIRDDVTNPAFPSGDSAQVLEFFKSFIA